MNSEKRETLHFRALLRVDRYNSFVRVEIEELRLAWRRYRRDLENRCFVDHPLMVSWIEANLDGWLTEVSEHLSAEYHPQPGRRCSVPKPGFMIRPGTVLEPEDAVVYAVLVGRAYQKIHEDVVANEGKIDIAYRTSDDPATVEWTKHDFTVWREWRAKSMLALKRGVTQVVVTDITGFYDNIPLQKLIADLRRLRVDEEVLALLQECLRKWSYPRDEGIPQGYSASDLRAKLYLSTLDRKFAREGYSHLRYVDDIRIFCRSTLEAKTAIWDLSKHLFQRGLTPQSGKTEILSKSDARAEFDGVAEIINELNAQLLDELRQSIGEGRYLKSAEIVAALADAENPPTPVLERAFEDYFGVGAGVPFDTSLFHYLLVRLGKVDSRIAVSYCLDTLRGRPEETEYVLRYFADIRLEDEELDNIAEYLGTPDAIYDYQLFQVVRWFLTEEIKHDSALGLARTWARDRNRDPWLRSYSIAYLGRYGDTEDLDDIEQAYAESTNDIERADRVAALKRMERSRRNAFYARTTGDGTLVERAVDVVKGRRN